MTSSATPVRPAVSALRTFVRRLLVFGWIQTRACVFAAALFLGMAASEALPDDLPVARYDLLLIYGVALTATGWAMRWETGREVAVIAVCHLLGFLFEAVKVHVGSWSYPEDALTKVAGVPLYGGFMYAAVGSYVCRSWRLFDLDFTGYRPRTTAVLAALVYLNFLTHHWLPDARWPLAAALLLATLGTRVSYTVGPARLRMPLALAFVLIGFFLWVAENLATYLGAWSYPHQLETWSPVPVTKWASWALLISFTFVIVKTARGTGPGPGASGPVSTTHPGIKEVGGYWWPRGRSLRTARHGTAEGGAAGGEHTDVMERVGASQGRGGGAAGDRDAAEPGGPAGRPVRWRPGGPPGRSGRRRP